MQVHYFRSNFGWHALAMDDKGKRLPKALGPWTHRQMIDLDDRASYPALLNEIKKDGYHLSNSDILVGTGNVRKMKVE